MAVRNSSFLTLKFRPTPLLRMDCRPKSFVSFMAMRKIGELFNTLRAGLQYIRTSILG